MTVRSIGRRCGCDCYEVRIAKMSFWGHSIRYCCMRYASFLCYEVYDRRAKTTYFFLLLIQRSRLFDTDRKTVDVQDQRIDIILIPRLSSSRGDNYDTDTRSLAIYSSAHTSARIRRGILRLLQARLQLHGFHAFFALLFHSPCEWGCISLNLFQEPANQPSNY